MTASRRSAATVFLRMNVRASRNMLAQQAFQTRLDVAGRGLTEVDDAGAIGCQFRPHQVDQRLLFGEDAVVTVAGETGDRVRFFRARDRMLQVVDDFIGAERRIGPAHRPLKIGSAKGRIALPAPLDQVVFQRARVRSYSAYTSESSSTGSAISS